MPVIAGGGLFMQVVAKQPLTVQDCTFISNNSTATGGGGILQQGEELTAQLVNNKFANNSGTCCYAGPDLSALGGTCSELSAGYGTGWSGLSSLVAYLQ